MASLTKTDPQFGEHLSGFLHELFRSAGLSMNATSAVERVRKVGDKMAKTIEWAAERKAIQVVQKLQAAVSAGFTGLERKLDEALAENEELKARIEAIEAIPLLNRIPRTEEEAGEGLGPANPK